jgi:hypothetical protein
MRDLVMLWEKLIHHGEIYNGSTRGNGSPAFESDSRGKSLLKYIVCCGSYSADWNSVALIAEWLASDPYIYSEMGFSKTNMLYAALLLIWPFRGGENMLTVPDRARIFSLSEPREKIHGLLGIPILRNIPELEKNLVQRGLRALFKTGEILSWYPYKFTIKKMHLKTLQVCAKIL